MSIKRFFATLLSLFLLLSLVACQTGDEADKTTGSENSTASSETDAESTVLKESPVENFKYSVIHNQAVYIIKYLGKDTHVVIPERIEGLPVFCLAGSSFANNNTLVSVVLPDTVISIFEEAFANCSSLETVVLSKNLTQIRSSAFLNCTKLSSITLPDTLTRIGNYAFENCASLKHINIPASLTDWGLHIFCESGIETIDFEEGVTYIGHGAFSDTKVKEIVFPNSLLAIDYGAFNRCKNLKSVTLNQGLQVIRGVAFGYLPNLTEITLPESIKHLDASFIGSNNLKKAMFEGDAPTITRVPFVDSCVVYYHEEAEGFSSEDWRNYTIAPW